MGSPLSMWENGGVDGRTVKRFEFVGDKDQDARQHDLSEPFAPSIRPSVNAKAQLKLAEETPQHTLTKRRLEAFYDFGVAD